MFTATAWFEMQMMNVFPINPSVSCTYPKSLVNFLFEPIVFTLRFVLSKFLVTNVVY